MSDTIISPDALTRRRTRRRFPGAPGLTSTMVMASVVVVAVSAAVYPMIPRYYVATADMMLQLTDREGAPAWEQSVQFALDDNAIQTKMDIARSQPVQLKVIQKNGLMSDPEFNRVLNPPPWKQWLRDTWWLAPWLPPQQTGEIAVADSLVRNLIAKREKKSYVLQLGYESLDPKKAAMLTNSMVDAFIEEDTEHKKQTHNAILKALGDRVRANQAVYDNAEQVRQHFIIDKGLDHTGQYQLWQQELATVAKQVAEARQRAITSKANADIITASMHSNELESTSVVQRSEVLQRMRQRYFELTTGAGSLTGPTSANSTVIVSMRAAIEVEMLRIAKAAANDAKVAEIEEAGLRTEADNIDRRMMTWEAGARHAVLLQRVVDVCKTAVDSANHAYLEAVSRGDVVQPDVNIISRPEVPLVPAFPSPKLYVVGTLFLVILIDGLLMLPKLLRRVG